MIRKLPTDTTTYLVSMLENKIETKPEDSVFLDRQLYVERYKPVGTDLILELLDSDWSKPIIGPSAKERKQQTEKAKKEITHGMTSGAPEHGGGFGSGKERKKNQEGAPSFSQILMGDAEEETDEPDNPLLKLLGAGTMATAGGLAGYGSKLLGGKLKGMGGLGGIAGQAIASLGKQAEELSGKNWIEAQLGKIGQSQMELAAQGAGSPWTKFVIPQKKTKLVTPRERALGAAQEEEQLKKYRGAGYNIP